MRESRNLLPNPKPTNTSQWKPCGGSTLIVRMLDAGIEWSDGDSHINAHPAEWFATLAARHHLDLVVVA